MMLSAMPMVAASPLDLLAREPISELSVHFAAAWTPPLSSLGRGADPAAQFTWSRRGPRRSGAILTSRNNRCQRPAGRAERQRRRHADPGGLARRAEIADLPATLAGQVAQVGVGVDRDGCADQR